MSTIVSEYLNDCTVSVVMCTYNGERFLEEQLDSILNQSWINLEILIADDASTDNTWSMLQSYAKKDARIQLFKNEKRLGYTENFSRNCARVTAPFLVIADQDDVWHLQKIEKLMAALPVSAPMIYCDSIRFSDTLPRDAKPNPKYRRFEGTEILKLALFNTISGHALLARTSFIHSLLPFPDELMYDWYAGAVAATQGGVVYFPETLVYQRVHDRNVSVGDGFHQQNQNSKRRYMEMVWKHAHAFSKIQNISPSVRQILENWTVILDDALNRRAQWPCFWFIMKHRTDFFSYKKRRFALLSHLKHAYRLSRCR